MRGRRCGDLRGRAAAEHEARHRANARIGVGDVDEPQHDRIAASHGGEPLEIVDDIRLGRRRGERVADGELADRLVRRARVDLQRRAASAMPAQLLANRIGFIAGGGACCALA